MRIFGGNDFGMSPVVHLHGIQFSRGNPAIKP
jgi:hypothetical protein